MNRCNQYNKLNICRKARHCKNGMLWKPHAGKSWQNYPSKTLRVILENVEFTRSISHVQKHQFIFSKFTQDHGKSQLEILKKQHPQYICNYPLSTLTPTHIIRRISLFDKLAALTGFKVTIHAIVLLSSPLFYQTESGQRSNFFLSNWTEDSMKTVVGSLLLSLPPSQYQHL